MAPLITTETARDMARRSAEARKGKGWTWEREAMRVLSRRLPDGQRRRSIVVEKLVSMAEAGDAKCIELLAKLSGWRPETIKNHVHGVSGDVLERLSIKGDGDRRGRAPDAGLLSERVQSDSGQVQCNVESVAQGQVVDVQATSVERAPPASNQAATETPGP